MWAAAAVEDVAARSGGCRAASRRRDNEDDEAKKRGAEREGRAWDMQLRARARVAHRLVRGNSQTE